MYNGGSRYTPGNGSGGSQRGGSTVRIGKYRVKTMYLYAAVALVGLVVLLSVTSALMGVLTSNLLAHFGVIAGALLLLANGRELMGKPQMHQRGMVLHNTLVGGALVCAWITQALALFWLPALLLLGLAVPLALGRSGVYLTYTQAARNATESVRRVVERGVEHKT